MRHLEKMVLSGIALSMLVGGTPAFAEEVATYELNPVLVTAQGSVTKGYGDTGGDRGTSCG